VSKAIVFGSSGLVGSLLPVKLREAGYDEVILVLRKPIDAAQGRVVLWDPAPERVELLKKELLDLIPEKSAVFIALGTTQKKAGSKKAFEWVDLDLPALISKAAEEKKAKAILMISSLGANPRSPNYYLRTKGLAEEWLRSVQIPARYVIRPSLLLGKRAEFRFGEWLAQGIMPLFNFLLIGSWKRYRPIEAERVARAMVKASIEPKEGFHVLENEDLTPLSS
jgi:uncharacterized protein YbjT (DUF2867 family)